MYTPPTITGYYINGNFYKPEETELSVDGKYRFPIKRKLVESAPSLTAEKDMSRTVSLPRRKRAKPTVDSTTRELKMIARAYCQTNKYNDIFIGKVKDHDLYVAIWKKGKKIIKQFIGDLPKRIKNVVLERHAVYSLGTQESI